MNYIKRDIEKLIESLSNEYSSILITGPRQVGKTTMLEKLFPTYNFISLDDLSNRKLAKEDPEMFLKINKDPIVIDEVQYAPELFSYLKIKIDRGAKPGSFILTGSQSFKLMKLAQESLAGRLAIIEMTTLSQNEIHNKNNLDYFTLDLDILLNKSYKKVDVNGIFSRIINGGMPAFISNKYTNRDIFYSSYLQTYITRDLLDDNEIRSLDFEKFYDFIKALASRTSQILNIHSVASDVMISDDTAKRWLYYLEKANIIYYLHPYSNNLLKRTIKKPKLYFFDTGLVSYITRYFNSEILLNGALSGAIFENYVINEIRKNYLNLGKEPPIYYYHDRDMVEIDLIIEENSFLYLLEIKKTNNPNLDMVKSFNKLFKNNFNVSKGAIICTKEEITALNKDILVIPVSLI